MHDIRTITLDLDDTLWAIGPVIRRAEKELQDWLVARYPGVAGSLLPGELAKIRTAVLADNVDRAHDLTFLRREVIARIGQAAGYTVDTDAAFAVFDNARNDLELFPDVRPALTSLKQRFRLIAVTNGNANLDKIGIRELFDGFVSARIAGAAKPAPSIFQAAVREGGAPAEKTVHVGDHPSMDIHGARTAGLRAVWINRSGGEWPQDLARPDAVVRNLQELDELLVRR